MKIEVDSILPSPNGLRCGASLHYSDLGPVRFVEVLVPWKLFTWHVQSAVLDRLNAEAEKAPEDPLF